MLAYGQIVLDDMCEHSVSMKILLTHQKMLGDPVLMSQLVSPLPFWVFQVAPEDVQGAFKGSSDLFLRYLT